MTWMIMWKLCIIAWWSTYKQQSIVSLVIVEAYIGCTLDGWYAGAEVECCNDGAFLHNWDPSRHWANADTHKEFYS